MSLDVSGMCWLRGDRAWVVEQRWRKTEQSRMDGFIQASAAALAVPPVKSNEYT